MRLKITHIYSKEDGKLLGFRLERLVFPWIRWIPWSWKWLSGYAPEHRRAMEHDIVFLLRINGMLEEKDEFN